ncbi:MAG: YgaP-like transmembrane domain [Anaerolineales bacterium]|jgi:hypothetical protein
MDYFFRFMVTRVGGIIRIVVGLVLIVVGICGGQGVVGYMMVIAGLVPLVAGVFDKCVFAALFRLPMDGAALRQKIK